MSLSNDLISQFVKVTKDKNNTDNGTTVYGTVVKVGDETYVKIDGSDQLTPVSTTTNVEADEKVSVLIKDHTAMVTGNVSSPAARTAEVEEIGTKITEVEILIADKVSTKQLEAQVARIDTLTSDNVTINKKLSAAEAEIAEINAEVANIDEIYAKKAEVDAVVATTVEAEIAKLDIIEAEDLEATNAEINNLKTTYAEVTGELEAQKADIEKLEAGQITVEQLEGKFANIDFANIDEAAIENFFSKSGMIENLVVGDGTIAGELVGVTIKGDLIEGNTVKADKLVIKGSDGIYYKLNFEAGTFQNGEAVPTDSLHGSVITAKSITAEKVSVKDLVAFGATIGGFHINNTALYSGAKASIDNTTQGVYLDSTGQMNIGDSSNFIKYYRAADGTYKLAISAESVRFSAGKSVEEVIDEKVNEVQVGGRNLLRETNQGIKRWRYQTEAAEYIMIPHVDETGTNGMQIVISANTSGWAFLQYDISELLYQLEPNTPYMFSFDAKTDNGRISNICIMKGNAQDPLTNSVTGIKPGDTWQRYTIALTTNSLEAIDHSYKQVLYFGVPASAFTLNIRNLKLEKGTKPTDWTPAPEDTDSKVEQASAEAAAASSKVDNLEIGGRNLILKSDFSDQTDYAWNDTYMSFDTENRTATLEITASGNNQSLYRSWSLSDYAKKNARGRKITLSFEYMITSELVRAEGDTCVVRVQMTVERDSATGGTHQYLVLDIPSFGTNVMTQWVKKTATLSISEYECSGINASVNMRGYTGAIKIRNLKSEFGDKPTDWTPAPEDVDANIDSSAKAANEHANKASQNAVDTAWSNTSDALADYVPNSDFDNYKGEVDGKFNAADQKIYDEVGKVDDKIEGTENNPGVKDRLNEVEKLKMHFEMKDDGLVIFAGNNPDNATSYLRLKLSPTEIGFYKQGAEEPFGKWDGDYFHTGNMVVKTNERAQFGAFAFVPRTNGSLSFLQVGEFNG